MSLGIRGVISGVLCLVAVSSRTRSRARVDDGKGTASLQPKERPPETAPVRQRELLRWARGALIVIAIIYAFLAGLRTVDDYDLGWQLANSRWVVQHGHISSVDVITYTVRGKPWVYPPLSGLALYGLYLLGGYAALSWFTAATLAAVTFLLVRRTQLLTAMLAIIAVPVIAIRTTPRADTFSIVLFASVLTILWRYHRSGGGGLWLLPGLQIIWVNLHWGFVYGLGLCGAYVFLEAVELCFPGRRTAARKRLLKSWPWLLASWLATFVNPWGPRLYLEVVMWGRNLADPQSAMVREFLPLRISWNHLLAGIFRWWNANTSSICWLLCVAGIAVAVSVAQKRPAAGALLAASVVIVLQRSRFIALFACVVVVLGGSVLSEALATLSTAIRREWAGTNGRMATIMGCLLFICGAALSFGRCYDLVSNRYYLSSGSASLFGTGLSWWYPQRALSFVEREHLPHNIFNTYDLGGFLAWRLPQYGVYVDSRGWPFFLTQLRTSSELVNEPPDSRAWQAETSTWAINTLVIPLSRVDGLEHFPKLMEFCESRTWRPVYFDEVSAVFLRRSPETQALIDRLQVDCKSVQFTAPLGDSTSRQQRGTMFNFWSNTGSLLGALGRIPEALDAMDKAQGLFPDSPDLHLQRGQVLMLMGKNYEAEKEYRQSIELEPRAGAWELLCDLMWSEQRYDEAIDALREAAEISFSPNNLYLKLGFLEAQRQRPQAALAAFDQAARFGVAQDSSTSAGAEFHAALAEGRGHAWFAMGETQRAVEFQAQAVRFAPNPRRWQDLARLYQVLGRTSDAERALQQIK